MRTFAVLSLAGLLVFSSPALVRAGDEPDAEKKAEEEEHAKEEARLLKKARRKVENDDKPEALADFKKLAEIAGARGHEKMAITALTEALPLVATTEEEVDLLDSLRWLEFRQGEWADCAKHLERLIELRPDDAIAANNLGAALQKLGRADEAVKAFERCLELDPGYSLARMSLGRSARQAGKLRKALRAHERLVEKAKSQPIGDTTWFMGFESEKQKAKAKGVDLDTEEKRVALIHLEVAVDHAFLDELDDAEKVLEKARKKFAEHELEPALDFAIDDLERALEQRPGHFQLRYLLALFHEARGDEAAKKAELEKFVAAEKIARAAAKKAREKLEEKPAEK